MFRSPVVPTPKVFQPACQGYATDAEGPWRGRTGACSPENLPARAPGWASLLRAGIVACCVLATASSPGAGQSAASDAGTGGVGTVRDSVGKGGSRAGLPDPALALASFDQVGDWVRAFHAPEAVPDGLAPCVGARVIVRIDGRVVGEGDSIGEPDALWRAAREAIADAGSGPAPVRDALWEESVRALLAHATVSVEFAGEPLALSEPDLAAIDASIAPGIEGVAARVGESWEMMFPSEMAWRETGPSRAAPALASRLLDDASRGVLSTLDLWREHGVVFFRVPVVLIAQRGPGEPGEFLFRGGEIVPPIAGAADLVAFAERGVEHLERVTGMSPESPGLAGAWRPHRGEASPVEATPLQHAIAAVALVRFAEVDQASPGARARARAIARRLMAALASGPMPSEEGPACALMWVALHELEAARDDQLRALYEACERVMAAHAGDPPAEGRSGASDAIVAWGHAERARAQGLDTRAIEVRVRSMAARTPQGELVALLPWLGWAELALHPEGALASAASLRQMRGLVWDHQLWGEDVGADAPDLAGGIVFTDALQPLPTWQSARPLAFLCTMLGDPRLTSPEERAGEVVRLLAAARFLVQLSARGAECHAYAQSERAIGGVRAAAWDHRMPPEATAMGILAASELLRALASAEGSGG